MELLKRIAARLPNRWQTELKRIYFWRKIRKGEFITNEPEYDILHTLIKPGDWVIDVGANVGHYTKRFSELAGAYGRVIALEPMPVTFSLLSANVQLFSHQNVTLLNSAASDALDIAGMSMPKFSTGLSNYYEAHLSKDTNSPLSVLTISIDSLFCDKNISLVKIDAEGHETLVLAGMKKLISNSHPYLIVETGSKEVISGLVALGYTPEILKNSPNVLFRPNTHK